MYETHICGFIHPTIRPDCGRPEEWAGLGKTAAPGKCRVTLQEQPKLKLFSFFRSFSGYTTRFKKK